MFLWTDLWPGACGGGPPGFISGIPTGGADGIHCKDVRGGAAVQHAHGRQQLDEAFSG